MILTGKSAFNEIINVIRRARRFCYILSAWIGGRVAKDMKNALNCETVVVVMRDYFEENAKTYNVMKQWDVLIHPDLHIKIIITENEYVAGSENFTEKGLFRNLGQVSFYSNTHEDYFSLLEMATDYINKSRPYDTNHPIEYWSNRNRPLETLPETLADPSVGVIEEVADLVDDNSIEDEVPEPIETKELTEEDKAARKNLSEAWGLLLGRKKE